MYQEDNFIFGMMYQPNLWCILYIVYIYIIYNYVHICKYVYVDSCAVLIRCSKLGKKKKRLESNWR